MNKSENKDINIPCIGLWSQSGIEQLIRDCGNGMFGLGGQWVRNVQDCEMSVNGIYEGTVAYGNICLKQPESRLTLFSPWGRMSSFSKHALMKQSNQITTIVNKNFKKAIQKFK